MPVSGASSAGTAIRSAGALAILFGGLVLAGWAFDIGMLKSLLPGWVAVKPNTALAFFFLGSAFWLQYNAPPSILRSRISRLCAVLAGLIGLLTLFEYGSGWNPGIDQWLFPEPPGMAGTSHPGRMAPDTALCFVLLAAGFESFRVSRKTQRPLVVSAILGFLVATIAVSAILAYISPALRALGWWGLTIMAPSTAAVFAGLGVAVVLGSWRDAFDPSLTRFSRHLWLMAACVGALAVAFALYARSENEIERANEKRYRSYLLADELRQSGDDLTRMVRTYVVTRDPKYKRYFQDILDIRDGKKPRPENYSRPYWDLVLGDSPAPRGSKEAIPLLELMRLAGFTEEEFGMLAEAKANSDALTVPEFEAMRLVESPGPEAEAGRAGAHRMLYDEKYHWAKVAVMRPIHDFFASVDRRTLAAVRAAENSATIFRSIFSAFGLLLIFVLWRTYIALGETLGGSVDEVYAHIARIGRGNFSAAIPVKAGLKNSVLGWLSETQAKLNGIDRERARAEEEIRTLNAELEQRVRDRTTQLEAANKELEAFSYSVSHDLRAPLRAIDGYSRILLEECEGRLEPEGRRVLGVISGETRRMGQLIDDLLAFSRMGRLSLESSEIDMTAMTRAVYRELAAQAPTRDLRLELKPLAPARGDRAMIRVVLGNLLSNAIKFTKLRDQAVIEIGSTQVEGQAVYHVKDNGVGFDMRYAHKLFGVFQRLHSSEEFEGTGVGLALVQRVIHRHGGRVRAEGKVDEGATLYFSLPSAEAEGKP